MSDGLPDCRECGACCIEAGPVPVYPSDAQVPRWRTRSIRSRPVFTQAHVRDGVRMMDRYMGGRCKALVGIVGTECSCAVYDRRPSVCSSFFRGSPGCHEARDRMLYKMNRPEALYRGYGDNWKETV